MNFRIIFVLEKIKFGKMQKICTYITMYWSTNKFPPFAKDGATNKL